MPTNREPLRRPHRGRISFTQEQSLWLGVPADAFVDDGERREAWELHRGRLLDLFGRNGRRPDAWWQFEAEALGLRYPGDDTEQSYLFEAGVLSELEVAGLIEFWKEQFTRAQEPGYGYCAGPGEWLKGKAARKAHIEWADVPASLVEQWSAERQKA